VRLRRIARYHLLGTFADVWLAKQDDLHRTGGRLDVVDQERATGMVIASAREEFTAGRLASRAVLAHYPPAVSGDTHLVRSADGRPGLADAPGWDVNLSHAGSLVVVAVGRRIRVGVDIEQEIPVRFAQPLARRYFSADECAELAALEPDQRAVLRRWLEIWTRKEAYVKASGEGVWAIAAHRVVEAGAGKHIALALPPRYVGTLAALPIR
jgi:4'-phosphopantetheinyl transferase